MFVKIRKSCLSGVFGPSLLMVCYGVFSFVDMSMTKCFRCCGYGHVSAMCTAKVVKCPHFAFVVVSTFSGRKSGKRDKSPGNSKWSGRGRREKAKSRGRVGGNI